MLRGNPGKRRLNDTEPQPPSSVVRRPAFLSASASVVWDSIAPAAKAMGTLTAADVQAFARLCELEATARANSAKKDTDPANFSVRVELDTANALKAYYDFFGLTPTGRSRIKLPKAEKPASKWAGLVG